MAKLRKSLRDWTLIIGLLLIFPLPFAAVWSALDGLQYWSWKDAARTAALAYVWELGGLAIVMAKSFYDDKQKAARQRRRQGDTTITKGA